MCGKLYTCTSKSRKTKCKQNFLINNYYANIVKRNSFKCHGHHPLLYSIILHLLCVDQISIMPKMQALSIKGRLTLKEVTVLDVVNLSARIQDAYLLRNSVRPIDMHTAFNRAIMDRPHVTNESFEYRWSSCGAKQLKTGVVLVAGVRTCISGGPVVFLMVSACVGS